MSQPLVIVFDVNETLSDMGPLAEAFAQVGAPRGLAKLWFATLLRDGFALTASGGKASFATIGADALRTLLGAEGISGNLETAVERVMAAMQNLSLHPDVPDGIRAVAAAGHRLVTLTNGATANTDKLLVAGGVRDKFELLLSVEDAPAWKPAKAAYEYAATAAGADPAKMLLVAVHPWDIHGAAKAGLRTVWINRTGARYPSYFQSPDITIPALTGLPAVLAA
ncbi:haloacid dehalogenase type II [Arthrobacter sp. FW306-05-C]|uniref:haloacid dehalogenase type II n=1 Tax=unclassified Arthrobacter TaxID=235627 RepID=UPI001EF0710D|nr:MULTISPECIES: haloacid dehalogenase type II [unclassified Arthrobacter]UKA65986.1 haloacid dehalogenase type II [Arthrobacter sp. FW306-05-C]UKA70340.1 haloacid dehalogenase type II [Arthrobacter sp. FW306-06-A]